MSVIGGMLLKPIVIEPSRFSLHGEDLERELPTIREEAADDIRERLAKLNDGATLVTEREVEEWHRTLCDIIDNLLAGRPFALRTPTECCAFTTVLDEADVDLAYCREFELRGIVLPECVAPLCAFADYDEFDVDEDDEFDDRPPIRHPMRRWRVTVTLEQIIDRTDHPCDPDICPLEVTLRKRVTFKTIEARTKYHAQTLALDRFEVTHGTRLGAEYWAKAVLIAEAAYPQAPGPTSPAATPRRQEDAP